jgi:hypothetical protein
MTIDSNKNVGIGVVPESDWHSTFNALQIGSAASLSSYTSASYSTSVQLANNMRQTIESYDTSNRYIYSDHPATKYYQDHNGNHIFKVAPDSGASGANTAISWTTVMKIDNDGDIEYGAFSSTGASNGIELNISSNTGRTNISSINSTSVMLGFYTTNGEVGSIKAEGSGTLYNTGNGGGIDFSGNAGTTATDATTTSQLLDDYEEGTWTPTLPNGGTVAGIGNASYTKIGRVVSWYFYITVNSIPSNTTVFRIGGLPYTVNTNSIYMGGTIGYVGNLNIETYGLMVLTLTNNDQIYFHRQDGNGSAATNSMFSSATTLLVSGQYYV